MRYTSRRSIRSYLVRLCKLAIVAYISMNLINQIFMSPKSTVNDRAVRPISHPNEWENPQPDPRALRPRSYNLDSNAPKLCLNGTWHFRFSKSPYISEDFAESSYQALKGWDEIPVPAHWVLHGDGKYGLPAYQNIQYPFPVDPPFVPDENPTGDYVRSFNIPKVWKMDGAKVSWRNVSRLMIR